MSHPKGIWLKTAIACGFLLAGVLVIQSLLTHQYVIDHLLIDHLSGEAGHYVSAIERRARDQNVTERAQLQALLDEIRSEDNEKIAWVRVTEQDGTALAATDGTPAESIPKSRINQILAFESPTVAELSPQTGVLVVTAPFHFRFPDQRIRDESSDARPQFKIAEVGLYVEGFNENKASYPATSWSPTRTAWSRRRALLVPTSENKESSTYFNTNGKDPCKT